MRKILAVWRKHDKCAGDSYNKKYGVINDIKNELLRLGALGSMMSGSGPSVFGIFENEKQAVLLMKALKTVSGNALLHKQYKN